MPESTDPARTARLRWFPVPCSWLIVPVAILAGLLLFFAVWLAQRGSSGEVSPPPVQALSPGRVQQAAPLPAPQPPELPGDSPSAEPGGGSVFALPDAPPAAAPMMSGEAPVRQSGPAAADGEIARGNQQPVPIHSPAPVYPERAARQRLSGEVVVRALVGADGRLRQVEIARSSSHRVLDQAALRAVRGWRFQPAMHQGREVAQTVHIPIEFNP